MSDVPRDIVFTRHDASHGLRWLRDAALMFAQARIGWLALLLAYYLVLAAIRVVPFVGAIAVFLLKPVFAVGFLAAAWTVERGGKPRMRHLLQGFQSNLSALLPIGVIIVLGISVAALASALVDGGKLIEFITNPPPASASEGADKVESVLGDVRVQLGMLFAALCALPVVLAVWFAPALVVFQDVRASQALAVSLRAALANWRPLAVYALAVFVFAGITPTLLVALLSLLLAGLSEGVRAMITYAVVLPYVAMIVAIMQIADYVSYRDLFHAGETLAPLPGS